MQYERVLFIDQGSSSLTIGERICVAFIPLIAIFEVLIFAFSDCFGPRQPRLKKCAEEIPRLVNETICKDFEVPSIHYMTFFLFYFLLLFFLTLSNNHTTCLDNLTSHKYYM